MTVLRFLLLVAASWGEVALGCKVYSFQSFAVGQVLTAAQMDQVEANIRDHQHGASSVANLGTTAAADTNNTTIATTAFVLGQAASQAELETGTSNTKFTTSGRQQFHQSSVKGWGRANSSGVAGNAYNATVTDTGTGIITWNWTTAFSGATYSAVPGIGTGSFNGSARVSNQLAGSCEVTVTNYAGVSTDPDTHHITTSGDQ